MWAWSLGGLNFGGLKFSGGGGAVWSEIFGGGCLVRNFWGGSGLKFSGGV